MKLTAQIIPYTLGFQTPLVTSQHRLEARHGLLLSLTTEDGTTGYGDAATWPDTLLSPSSLQEILETTFCVERPPLRIGNWPSPFVHAVELAWLDLCAKYAKKPLALFLQEDARLVAPSHVLVHDLRSAREAVERGAEILKCKVGARPLRDEIVFLETLRRELGSQIRLRLDANEAWTRDEAAEALLQFSAFKVDFVEQPVARGDLKSLSWLRKKSNIPIAADESLRDEADLAALVATGAADVAVIKPMLCGGIRAAMRLCMQAREAGLRALLTHSLESAVGRLGAMHCAAALPWLDAGGLASPSFTRDLAESPIFVGGAFQLSAVPGLGGRA